MQKKSEKDKNTEQEKSHKNTSKNWFAGMKSNEVKPETEALFFNF